MPFTVPSLTDGIISSTIIHCRMTQFQETEQTALAAERTFF